MLDVLPQFYKHSVAVAQLSNHFFSCLEALEGKRFNEEV
jgi:hypothetical protein